MLEQIEALVDEAGFWAVIVEDLEVVVIRVDDGDDYDILELESMYDARLAVRYFKPY